MGPLPVGDWPGKRCHGNVGHHQMTTIGIGDMFATIRQTSQAVRDASKAKRFRDRGGIWKPLSPSKNKLMALLDPQAFQDVIEEPQSTQAEKEALARLPSMSPTKHVVKRKATGPLLLTKQRVNKKASKKQEERGDPAPQTSEADDTQLLKPVKRGKTKKSTDPEPIIAEDPKLKCVNLSNQDQKGHKIGVGARIKSIKKGAKIYSDEEIKEQVKTTESRAIDIDERLPKKAGKKRTIKEASKHKDQVSRPSPGKKAKIQTAEGSIEVQPRKIRTKVTKNSSKEKDAGETPETVVELSGNKHHPVSLLSSLYPPAPEVIKARERKRVRDPDKEIGQPPPPKRRKKNGSSKRQDEDCPNLLDNEEGLPQRKTRGVPKSNTRAKAKDCRDETQKSPHGDLDKSTSTVRLSVIQEQGLEVGMVGPPALVLKKPGNIQPQQMTSKSDDNNPAKRASQDLGRTKRKRKKVQPQLDDVATMDDVRELAEVETPRQPGNQAKATIPKRRSGRRAPKLKPIVERSPISTPPANLESGVQDSKAKTESKQPTSKAAVIPSDEGAHLVKTKVKAGTGRAQRHKNDPPDCSGQEITQQSMKSSHVHKSRRVQEESVVESDFDELDLLS
ncbi:hypothetical protein BU17DRAFT_67796 [Hysterangium stoloniferum]|nr:hypothetical protein BU17DRAFT_67796 [Hysterangium stoloniferum]